MNQFDPQPEEADGDAAHPIQVVARRTGLSADVIRAWERRYEAVTPIRARNSRRLYTNADVERLILLRQATQLGRRISDVASLSVEALRQLVQTDERLLLEQQPHQTPPTIPPARQYWSRCIHAVQRLDAHELESTLQDAAHNLSMVLLLNEVVQPLLNYIAEQWRAGELRQCHEHMAAAQVKFFLGNLMNNTSALVRGPELVVASPLRQQRESEALMMAVAAATAGWGPLYLGADMPSEEIAFAAQMREVGVVALAISYPADDPGLPQLLRRLRERLPVLTRLFASGTACHGYRNTLDELGFTVLSRPPDLRLELDQLLYKNGAN